MKRCIWQAVTIVAAFSSAAQASDDLVGVTAIAASGDHTCALTMDGHVKCWGQFYSGFAPASAPIELFPGGVRAMATSFGLTCAVFEVGAVGCVGAYPYYALPSYAPATPTEVADIAVGDNHICILTESGGVKCWGDNPFGQLGNGSGSYSVSPVDVIGLGSGVKSISAGLQHTCALMVSGSVKCWGSNSLNFLGSIPMGQLGDGTDAIFRSAPVDVVDLPTGVQSISAQPYSTCAVVAGGEVKCWGYRPTQEAGLASGIAMVAGDVYRLQTSLSLPPQIYPHRCAVTALAAAECWGANPNGELGDGTLTPRSTPAPVSGLASGVTSVAVGRAHACALTDDGRVHCWGRNQEGQLGDGTQVDRLVPTTVGNGIELHTSTIGFGKGTITSDPGGIDCGSQCSATFPALTSVTLTANPAPGSRFVGWGGDGCSGTEPCTVSMTFYRNVWATFAVTSTLPRLANISTRLRVGEGENVAIAGFVIGPGASKNVVVTAKSPSLTAYGISDVFNPSLRLVRASDNAVIASNDDWGTGDASALMASTFAPSVPSEAAILANLEPGAYTAIVSGPVGASGVALVEVYEVDAPATALLNISTRGQVGIGNDVMIGGFVIGGDAPMTIVVTAKGPSLSQFGLQNPLSNPKLSLVRASDNAIIASNDDWGSSANASAILASGFAPGNPIESAILITLDPGAYTAIVEGEGRAGLGIVEVYKVGQ